MSKIPNSVSPYIVLGWAHAYCCSLLDNDQDPRKIPVPEMVARAEQDLDPDTMFSNLSIALNDTKDLLEYAMTIICNVRGGNWDKETEDWQGAAERFIEQYNELR